MEQFSPLPARRCLSLTLALTGLLMALAACGQHALPGAQQPQAQGAETQPTDTAGQNDTGGVDAAAAAAADLTLSSTDPSTSDTLSTQSTAVFTTTGAEAVRRGKVWVDAGVPYNQGGYHQGYREDCAGFVSMAWGVNKSGKPFSFLVHTSVDYAHDINVMNVKPGDALYAANFSHMILFVKWASSADASSTTIKHAVIYAERYEGVPTAQRTYTLRKHSNGTWTIDELNGDVYRAERSDHIK